jgi:quinol monooxygenase YgiN
MAARLPRLDVPLDTTGKQDPDLARDLAHLGRRQLRQVRTYETSHPPSASSSPPERPRDSPKENRMSVIVVATAFPIPEHRAEVITAFEAAIIRVHDEPCVDLYALHEGRDRLVMIEKYASQDAFARHGQSPALADLRASLAGKLSGDLDVQVLMPHPAGTPQQGTL